MALFPGLLLHGAGHLYLGEERTGVVLALLEIGGLGLLAAGAAGPWVVRGELAGSGAARPAFYMGVGMLLASYIIDVVGVARGENPAIYATPERRRGAWFEAHYRFLNATRYPLRNVLEMQLGADTGQVYGAAGTLQDVSLATSRYGGVAGWRPWSLGATANQVFVEVDAHLWQLRARGRFRRLALGARAGGVLDLGVISPDLRRMMLGASAGYQHQWYALPVARPPEQDREEDDPPPLAPAYALGTVPFELFGAMSLTDRVFLKLSYVRQDGELLQDVGRLWGVPGAELVYQLSPGWDLDLSARYGAGFELAGGLRIWGWQ